MWAKNDPPFNAVPTKYPKSIYLHSVEKIIERFGAQLIAFVTPLLAFIKTYASPKSETQIR